MYSTAFRNRARRAAALTALTLAPVTVATGLAMAALPASATSSASAAAAISALKRPAAKHQTAPAAKHRAAPAPKHQTVPAAKHRAAPAAKRKAAPAAKRRADPPINLTGGGDRLTDGSVSGLQNMLFTSPPGSCPTDAGGRCTITADASSTGYQVTQASVPSDWYLSPQLGIGNGAANITPTNYTTASTGPLTAAGVNMPAASSGSATSATARGSVWAASRTDPSLPSTCGLNVALLFDLSTSIISPTNHLGDLKAAGQEFVRALAGTPSKVALYTFGSVAPAPGANDDNTAITPVPTMASAQPLISRIGGYSVTSGQATNWDQGLWQIANSPAHYNLAVMLTDGDPTRYGEAGLGTGALTRFIDVENGMFSANALKKEHTKVVAVGINATRAGSIANLRAISGTVAGDDYYETDFTHLPELLDTIAKENCVGTVNVTKLVIPASHRGDFHAGVPTPGWHFSASPSTVVPRSGTTGDSGAISFATMTTVPEPVTITETPPTTAPYRPVPQPNGDNAVCENSEGHHVPVMNSGPLGFTVTADPADVISCRVYDQAPKKVRDPASVVVNKKWVINGVAQRDGSQDPDFQANLSLSPLYPPDEPATWGEERYGYKEGQKVTIAEGDVRIPADCVLSASGDLGRHRLRAGSNTFDVKNTVTCDTKLTLAKRIDNPFPHVKPAPLTSWTLTARHATTGAEAVRGTTGVTGTIEPNQRYVLSESSVPGYKQVVDPAVTALHPGATGSWACLQNLPGGRSGLEDFDGGDGTVSVPPGEHVTCTATNRLKRAIPVGPAPTGGGFAPARTSAPMTAGGVALVAAGLLLGAAGLRLRRRSTRSTLLYGTDKGDSP